MITIPIWTLVVLVVLAIWALVLTFGPTEFKFLTLALVDAIIPAIRRAIKIHRIYSDFERVFFPKKRRRRPRRKKGHPKRVRTGRRKK